MPFDTQTPVAVGDLTFDVRLDGPDDGEPVVLLHGFPETSRSWTAVATRLVDEGMRVVAPDQRGYSPGARPTGIDAYDSVLLAADVVGLADALDLGTFHLAGHDWGSVVAWQVAARHGDRLRTLTTVSVPHLAAFNQALREDARQRESSRYMQLFRQEGKAEHVLLKEGAAALRAMYQGVVPADQVEAYVQHLQEPGALTAALSWYRAMTAELADMPPVDVPTTFVWSDEDQALGRYGAERCGEHVTADYRFVELAGVTHWVPEEAPDSLAEAIITRIRTT